MNTEYHYIQIVGIIRDNTNTGMRTTRLSLRRWRPGLLWEPPSSPLLVSWENPSRLSELVRMSQNCQMR